MGWRKRSPGISVSLGNHDPKFEFLTDTEVIASLQTEALPAAVPEPATWVMILLGFGAIGLALRTHRRFASVHTAD